MLYPLFNFFHDFFKKFLFGHIVHVHVLHWELLAICLYAGLQHCHLLKMVLPLFNYL